MHLSLKKKLCTSFGFCIGTTTLAMFQVVPKIIGKHEYPQYIENPNRHKRQWPGAYESISQGRFTSITKSLRRTQCGREDFQFRRVPKRGTDNALEKFQTPTPPAISSSSSSPSSSSSFSSSLFSTSSLSWPNPLPSPLLNRNSAARSHTATQ